LGIGRYFHPCKIQTKCRCFVLARNQPNLCRLRRNNTCATLKLRYQRKALKLSSMPLLNCYVQSITKLNSSCCYFELNFYSNKNVAIFKYAERSCTKIFLWNTTTLQFRFCGHTNCMRPRCADFTCAWQ
jgi:hypothetical protein